MLLWLGGIAAVTLLGNAFAGTTTCGGGVGKAKVRRVKADLGVIARRIRRFGAEQDRLPVALEELVHRPANVRTWPPGGYLEFLPLDPWGAAYMLKEPSDCGGDFEVISLGADNEPGGRGEDADLSSRVLESGLDRP